MINIDGIDLPFDYVCGSKSWPSKDPNDSPFSKYVCRLCGGKIVFKEYGEWYISDGDPRMKALESVKWHYDHCPKKGCYNEAK